MLSVLIGILIIVVAIPAMALMAPVSANEAERGGSTIRPPTPAGRPATPPLCDRKESELFSQCCLAYFEG